MVQKLNQSQIISQLMKNHSNSLLQVRILENNKANLKNKIKLIKTFMIKEQGESSKKLNKIKKQLKECEEIKQQLETNKKQLVEERENFSKYLKTCEDKLKTLNKSKGDTSGTKKNPTRQARFDKTYKGMAK